MDEIKQINNSETKIQQKLNAKILYYTYNERKRGKYKFICI